VTTIAAFEIRFRRFLDPEGQAVAPLPSFAQDPSNLIPLYRAMARNRAFDAKAIELQRTGRLGTFASSLGQEAVAIGIAAAMDADDVFLPSFREHGTQLWRGVTAHELFLYWGGDERGSDFAGPRRDFPVCIPVASQAPHAVGVALAMKLRGEKQAAVCMLGDGATSKGDFYESLNFAGVWKLPVLFVVNNNQWAISVPRSAQSAAETLAQKAVAAGIPGEQVDGNDVIAVQLAAEEALARAREGNGATLIEALTYRLADHTTADDARRYRDDEEVARHWREEPVARLRAHLVGNGSWSKEDEEKLLSDCAAEVEAAMETYLATAAEPPQAMFDHLYETLPEDLKPQRAALIEEAEAEEARGNA
jgi:pyruvate dehydrogenase E1 component alpha subunit